jgi:G6PDH family F420-dependent oxidoreductase
MIYGALICNKVKNAKIFLLSTVCLSHRIGVVNMVEIGFKLISEIFGPNELISYAKHAEEAGFDFASISDHYHPWLSQQGNSPFVWSTLGGISQVTDNINLMTGVTCPTFRQHPALVAQAVATIAVLMPGRFILGVGSGENLNEHIYGDQWPSAPIRIEMLVEAVDVIRTLWQGGMQDYDGIYYHLENAQIYTLPDELPPIYMAADGPIAADAAADNADGIIVSGGKKEILDFFMRNGGKGKPSYTEISSSWAETDEKAVDLVYKYWPIVAIKGNISWEIPTQTHFEGLAENVKKEDVPTSIPCSSDPQIHIDSIKKAEESGFGKICVQQIGDNQHECIDFYREEVLPEFK